MPSAVADALLPAQRNPAQPPQGFWGNAGRFAYDALGLGDVAKALRGQMTPNEAQDFAFGAAAGLLPIGRAIKPVAKGIRAYHGSPHDFDRFDMSKIGTGEGAQAYGHGLYFAENEGVARSYKAAGQPSYVGADRIQAAQDLLKEAGGDRRAAIELAHQRMKSTTKYSEGKLWTDVVNNFDDLVGKGPGRMYEVNINAHPEQFLDWDKPLSKQGAHVQENVGNLVRGNEELQSVLPTAVGENVYTRLLPMHGIGRGAGIDHERISGALREAGIPGIKYLDQGSRTAGEGSRNYVVFDDKLIDIIKKYGLAALGLPPAMTAGSQIWNSQTQQ
jgi:hypothetical protein